MPVFRELAVGQALPMATQTPDNVQLFFYNAVLWNAHRIHFDLPYTQDVEGYPGLVIAGPLMGDWLAQCVTSWLGDDGRLQRIEYSNRQAAYIGQTLSVGGEIVGLDVEASTAELTLFVKNEQGDVITPGRATVHLPNS